MIFLFFCFFFFKQKTAYEMRISDWSSDVCSSDLDACLAFDPEHQWRGKLVDMHPKDWPLTKKRNPTIPAIGPLLPILKDWKKDPHKIVRSRRTAWRKMREALELPDNIVPKTIRHTVATQIGRPAWRERVGQYV